MTISYNWLCDYLPVKIDPERLSKILTSIGLEVESLEKYESVKGGLQGLVIGEVLECSPHPNADKLTLTKVNTGGPEPLSIVCGAPNVAVGQKVVVAPTGATIYPVKGEPLTMKVARIRGIESHGMICAEDEIGLGESHAGIIVLPANAKVGMTAAAWFHPYTDHIFEIGLTPNHMDAMSHQGVARDVCAWLSHHDNKELRPKLPSLNAFKVDNNSLPITAQIRNTTACERYSGLSLKGITIKESPQWMQDRLKAIGIRAINNIVDITNYVLHETGLPLHAFDLDAIKGNTIIVQNLPEGTPFVTLDQKERKLSAEDLMICNTAEPMAIAGVFGGLHSGVTAQTRNIFLEAAWFSPIGIRKTSFRHGLRTDAAAHFEKGMDISATLSSLKRAALLVKELAGGEIASELVDVYPDPKNKTQVILKYHYLKKLSGKNYHPDTIRDILLNLGFEIIKEGMDAIHVCVPWHKPDITLPADIVEEIMRIDGLDNITIPAAITISPSIEAGRSQAAWKNNVSGWLIGQGFYEILTNSITNSAYYSGQELSTAVKMINNLSADLNILRPSLLETGLESIAYNLNRKQLNLRLFEFGKSYRSEAVGHYVETDHCCLYVTGPLQEDSWKGKGTSSDIYYMKGLCEQILKIIGLTTPDWVPLRAAGSSHKEALTAGPSHQHTPAAGTSHQDAPAASPAHQQDKAPATEDSAAAKLTGGLAMIVNGQTLLKIGKVGPALLRQFDCRQDVFFADLHWGLLMEMASRNNIEFRELPRQLPVHRDLAMIVDHQLPFEKVEKTIRSIRLEKLQDVKLFDIFESEKLGAGRKSLAISLTFLDEDKTPTDKEIDTMVGKIMNALEKDLQVEIRK